MKPFKILTLIGLFLSTVCAYATPNSVSNLENYVLESASIGRYNKGGIWNHSDAAILTGPGLFSTVAGDGIYDDIDVEVKLQFRSQDGETVKIVIIPATMNLKYRGLPWRASMERVSMGIHNARGQKISSLFGKYAGGSIFFGAVLSLGEKILKKADSGIFINHLSLFFGLGAEIARTEAVLTAAPSQNVNVYEYHKKPNENNFVDQTEVELRDIFEHIM